MNLNNIFIALNFFSLKVVIFIFEKFGSKYEGGLLDVFDM